MHPAVGFADGWSLFVLAGQASRDQLRRVQLQRQIERSPRLKALAIGFLCGMIICFLFIAISAVPA